MLNVSDLEKVTRTYLSTEEISNIRRAYEFGQKAHKGQLRKSGEPFIHHPLEVARILADMHMDYQTLCAAILHDVIEDTDTAKSEIHNCLIKMLLSWWTA